MRLFVGEPVWTPYNREEITEENPSRVKYSEVFVKPLIASVDEQEGSETKKQKVEE